MATRHRHSSRTSCACLFLTATRRAMVSDMTWDEIEGRDWTVPGSRNKGGKPHLVPLTDTVIGLLGDRSERALCSQSDGGKTPFSGFSKAKAALDAKLAELRKRDGRKPMAPWVLHDLRRTAQLAVERPVCQRPCRARARSCHPRRARCLRSARISQPRSSTRWKSLAHWSSASSPRRQGCRLSEARAAESQRPSSIIDGGLKLTAR